MKNGTFVEDVSVFLIQNISNIMIFQLSCVTLFNWSVLRISFNFFDLFCPPPKKKSNGRMPFNKKRGEKIGQGTEITLPETNSLLAPERPKRPNRKPDHLPTINFQGRFDVSFREGIRNLSGSHL